MRLLHACPPSCKRPPVDDTECEQALARRRPEGRRPRQKHLLRLAPPATPPASSTPWPTPCRSQSNPSRSTAAPSSWPTSSAPTAPPASSSGTGTTAHPPAPASRRGSPSTNASTTTSGRTGRWTAERPTSILSTSKAFPKRRPKIPKCPEPLQRIDFFASRGHNSHQGLGIPGRQLASVEHRGLLLFGEAFQTPPFYLTFVVPIELLL